MKYFLVFIILIAFNVHLNAQPAATKTVTYDLCYPDEAHPLNNAVLTNLMSSLPRKNDKACMTFQATFSFKYRVTGANFRTEIFCDDVKLTHPINFQEFDLSSEIFPVKANVLVKVDNQSKTFHHKLKKGAKIGDILTPDQPQTFEITIKSVETGQEVLSRIVEKQQHISAYYTADTQIKLAFEELETIHPDSVAQIDKYLDITRYNMAIVKRIKDKELYKKLNLGKHDPLNVYERTSQLHKATFEAKNKLTSQSNNLAEEYLRLGIDAIQSQDTATANEYFDKALEIDSKLAGAHVEKTKIDFNRKKYKDVIQQIRFISAKTTHHSGDRDDMVLMIKEIEDQILDAADQQNKEEHYHEALSLLDSAENICNSIQVVVCSDMINVFRSHSWRGLLNQNIINWFGIISRNQYSELPQVIEETFQFRRDHNKWLTTNELLYTNLRIIQDTLIQVADKYRQNNPQKALEALYAAREICNAYVEIPCAENLEEQFKAAFKESYKQMLNQANAKLADSLPNSADSIQRKAMQYCQAQDIAISQKHKEIITHINAQRYSLLMQKIRQSKLPEKRTITLLDSAITLRKNSSVEQANDEKFQKTRLLTDYVSMLADKSERMLNAEQVVIATQLLQEIDWVVARFEYVLSDGQQDYLNQLRQKIGTQACYKKSQQKQIYQIAAQTFKRRNDYPHAKQSLETALGIIQNNKDCGFNPKEIKDEIKRITPAADYQEQLNRLKEFAVNNKFDDAIRIYDQIKADYNDSALNKFDIEIISLNEMAKNLNYLPFVHHAAKVLAERGKPNDSFGLITYLYKNEYDHKLSYPAQKELGASLAKEFYIKDPSEESGSLYKGYIIENKWSKPFKKAFQKQWKEMQIESE